jgi:hypothetical protein
VVVSCEYGDEPSGSGATESVSYMIFRTNTIISLNIYQLILIIAMYCAFSEVRTELHFALQRVNDISLMQEL